MPASLFQILGNQNTGLQQAAPADNTQQIANIAATGASGKTQAGAAAPKASNLGEQSAVQETTNNLKQLAQQQKQTSVSQQMQSLNMSKENAVQNAQLDQNVLDSRQQFTQQSSALLQDFERGTKSLASDKNKADVEQLGFNLRLSSDKYVNDLQVAGSEARLDNQLSFQDAANRTQLASTFANAQDQAKFQQVFAQSDADFSVYISSIDVDTAIGIVNAQSAAAQNATLGAGLGVAATAGAKYYANTANAPETVNAETGMTPTEQKEANTEATQEANNG